MDTDYDYKEAMKLENQLCFPLYAAARAVTGLYTPWLKELGLTYTQYLVFLVLWERDHIPAGEICSRLHLDTGTISPLLKKMEKAGYAVAFGMADYQKKAKKALWPEPAMKEINISKNGMTKITIQPMGGIIINSPSPTLPDEEGSSNS